MTAASALAEKVVGSSNSVTWNEYLVAGGALVGVRFTMVPASGSPVTKQTRYFVGDHLGSVAVITDETGAVAERKSYDAWGKPRFPNGNDDPSGSITSQSTRGYTAHEHIPSVGLINMNGRVQDPQIGKFVSADPIIQDIEDSQALNRFAYVQNRPLSATDPSGFDLEEIVATARRHKDISPAIAIDIPGLSFLGSSSNFDFSSTGATPSGANPTGSSGVPGAANNTKGHASNTQRAKEGERRLRDQNEKFDSPPDPTEEIEVTARRPGHPHGKQTPFNRNLGNEEPSVFSPAIPDDLVAAGRGRGGQQKGERGKTHSPEGTDNPGKHYKPGPKPGTRIFKDPQSGKKIEKPWPDDPRLKDNNGNNNPYILCAGPCDDGGNGIYIVPIPPTFGPGGVPVPAPVPFGAVPVIP